MKNSIFTYSDSEAGDQTQSFSLLSEIIKYIEDFGYNGDSEGLIYQDGQPILQYVSREDSLAWTSYEAE